MSILDCWTLSLRCREQWDFTQHQQLPRPIGTPMYDRWSLAENDHVDTLSLHELSSPLPSQTVYAPGV